MQLKLMCLFLTKGRVPKKLRKFGHMSELGLPYLPRSLVWTKKVWESTPIVYPTYLFKMFGNFLIEILSLHEYFLTFVRILLVDNHARHYQGHL